jgi:hypothetical protein
MPICTDVRQIRSPVVHALFDWWMSSRGPSGLPDRRSFDPTEHKTLVANMMICDLEPEPFRVRYRLVGTGVTAITGFDFTGKYLDEVLGPKATEPWLDYYQQVARTRAPLLGSVTEPTASGGTFMYEFGIFPVARGGSEVQQFLSVEDYFGATLVGASLQPWPPSA